jgi:putative CocE/NonD family hydrolase
LDAIIGTGKISKRQYEIIAERNVDVIVSDGVNINVDIFRPDSRKKFPALVAMSPYNKEAQTDRIWPAAVRRTIHRGIGNGGIEAGPTDFFVRRGYVHIIGSVRGTGKSGGAYRFICPREIRDICEVIEWAAE